MLLHSKISEQKLLNNRFMVQYRLHRQHLTLKTHYALILTQDQYVKSTLETMRNVFFTLKVRLLQLNALEFL